MISLSDYQLRIIMDLAAPLPPHRRAEFLERIAKQVGHRAGDGELYRVAIAVQRAMLPRNPMPEDSPAVAKELIRG